MKWFVRETNKLIHNMNIHQTYKCNLELQGWPGDKQKWPPGILTFINFEPPGFENIVKTGDRKTGGPAGAADADADDDDDGAEADADADADADAAARNQPRAAQD